MNCGIVTGYNMVGSCRIKSGAAGYSINSQEHLNVHEDVFVDDDALALV